MKRAAGYIRVSTKEQVSGESLSTQTESIKKYVKEKDWNWLKYIGMRVSPAVQLKKGWAFKNAL